MAMKDVKFETYASLRIRGAILDQIRKMDWIPRTIRQKQKRIDAAIKEIETQYGRSATDEEIARLLGITDEEYLDWQSQMKITNVVSLNEFLEQGSEVSNEAGSTKSAAFDSPEEILERDELKKVLAQALELLTEKERKVIVLYYYEDLTLKEISNILEVSESRISQLHTRALQKMRGKLGDYIGILTDTDILSCPSAGRIGSGVLPPPDKQGTGPVPFSTRPFNEMPAPQGCSPRKDRTGTECL